MTSLIHFSIIIPLYNKHNSVAETIKSGLNQTHVFFELIIVDDGSTDGSIDVVNGFSDSRIKLFRQKNAGVSAARNRGIREAKNDHISFLDADDLWEPNYLEEMNSFIKEFPEAGMYGCAYDRVNGETAELVNFHLPFSYKDNVYNYFEHANKNHLFWTSAVVLKKSVFEKTGFFDERMNTGEDLDLWFRVAFDHNVAFCNKVLAHYNEGAENRAMVKRHDLSQSILSYTLKYKDMERDNAAFRIFINHFRFSKIPELFSQYQISSNEIITFMSSIDAQELNFGRKLFLKFPLLMQKAIIYFWKMSMRA